MKDSKYISYTLHKKSFVLKSYVSFTVSKTVPSILEIFSSNCFVKQISTIYGIYLSLHRILFCPNYIIFQYCLCYEIHFLTYSAILILLYLFFLHFSSNFSNFFNKISCKSNNFVLYYYKCFEILYIISRCSAVGSARGLGP